MYLENEIRKNAQKFNINEKIIEISLNRGVAVEKLEEFFFPEKIELADPNDLAGVPEACQRIAEAIEKKEKILIYGDYDADGITSTALLYIALKSVSDFVYFYIPERDSEGYGLNDNALHQALTDGIDLVITVDCGIKSALLIEKYCGLGLDFIITDHHTPDELLPKTIIVNPRVECKEPFLDLAGVGVALKIAECLSGRFPLIMEKMSVYLQLASIGTIADLVNLSYENRKIVKKGIIELNNRPIKGLEGLIKKCNIQEINSKTISFVIAPIINSSGRMESPEKALRLLLSDERKEIEDLAEELILINNKRKALVEKVYREAKKVILENQYYLDPVIVVQKSGWPLGVLGIVAAKLVGEYKRPSVVLSDNEGDLYKGSARSIQKFNIIEALDTQKDILFEFGGHSQAAGLSIKKESINVFRTGLRKIAYFQLNMEDYRDEIKADLVLNDLSEANLSLYEDLAYLEPFGNGNPEPLFTLKNKIKIKISKIGRLQDHLRIEIAEKYKEIKGIYFNFQEYEEGIFESNLIFSLGINEWRNKISLQLEVKRIQDAEEISLCNLEQEIYGNFIYYKEKKDKDFTFIKKIQYNEIWSKIQKGKSIVYVSPNLEDINSIDFFRSEEVVYFDSRKDFFENYSSLKAFLNDKCNYLFTDIVLLKEELLELTENYLFLEQPLTKNVYLEIRNKKPDLSVFTVQEETTCENDFTPDKKMLTDFYLFFRKALSNYHYCGKIEDLRSKVSNFIKKEIKAVELLSGIIIFEELGFLNYSLKNENIEISFNNTIQKNPLENSNFYYNMIQNINT